MTPTMDLEDHNFLVNGTIHEVHAEVQEHLFHNPHLYEREETQDLLYGLVLPIFAGISLFANSMICLVLTFTHTNQGKDASLSFDRLLQCLSCYDIAVSLMTVWICSVPNWFYGSDYAREIHPLLLPYLIPVLHMAITGSDYLNLAAAVERYLATDRHFRDGRGTYHEGCAPKRTNFFILVILMFTVAFNIPALWELETVRNENFQPSLFDNLTSGVLIVSEGDSVYEVITSSLRHNDVYNKMYRLMAEFLIFKATPWMSFFILFLTMKHRIAYYNKRKIRRTLTMRQYNELQDSRIVLGITFLFYGTNVLPLYISFCHILLFDIDNVIICAANVSLVINSTLKFFIYVMLSPGFRKRFLRLFCCKKDEDEFGRREKSGEKGKALL